MFNSLSKDNRMCDFVTFVVTVILNIAILDFHFCSGHFCFTKIFCLKLYIFNQNEFCPCILLIRMVFCVAATVDIDR